MPTQRGAYPPDPYGYHGAYYTAVQQDSRQQQQYAIARHSSYPQVPVSGVPASYGSQTIDPGYDPSQVRYEGDPQSWGDVDSPRVALGPGHEQEDPRRRTDEFVHSRRSNLLGTRYPSSDSDPGERGRQDAGATIQTFDSRFSPTSDSRTQASQQESWPAHAQDDDFTYAQGYPANIQDLDLAYGHGHGAAYGQDDYQAYYQGQDQDPFDTPGYPANAQVHNDAGYSHHRRHRRSGGRSSRSQR
ncbi:hypothetical protein ACJ41O_008688 [Fusarium nematophilum]